MGVRNIIRNLVENGLYYLTEHAILSSPFMRTCLKMKNNRAGFWKNETCEYCGGGIVEKRVDFPKKAGSSYVIFKSVPAGVCSECGVKYFSANTLKIIEQKAKRKKDAKKVLQVPVLSF